MYLLIVGTVHSLYIGAAAGCIVWYTDPAFDMGAAGMMGASFVLPLLQQNTVAKTLELH